MSTSATDIYIIKTDIDSKIKSRIHIISTRISNREE